MSINCSSFTTEKMMILLFSFYKDMHRKTFEGLTYYTNLRINIEKVDCSERVIRQVLYWEELGSVEEPTGTVTPFVVLINTRCTRKKERYNRWGISHWSFQISRSGLKMKISQFCIGTPSGLEWLKKSASFLGFSHFIYKEYECLNFSPVLDIHGSVWTKIKTGLRS